MLVKKTNMPDISYLKPKAVSCFIAGSLVGRDSDKTNIEKKMLPVLARLIDKAIMEYTRAKELMAAEEAESEMSYEEILKRDQGQFIYTCSIIDHLENCVTTLARIYKVKGRYMGHTKNQSIIDIRDSVEHVDERIRDAIDELPVLNISEDSLVIEIAARNQGKVSIKTKDISEEIISLYNEIKKLL